MSNNPTTYLRWRENKLRDYPTQVSDLIVECGDPFNPDKSVLDKICRLCRKTNLAIYRFGVDVSVEKAALRAFSQNFGLHHLDHNLCADADGIATLQVADKSRGQDYIPYSSRPINWHTDGYYNAAQEQVRGVVLHCVQAAAEGGENACMDHEMAYLLMRDANPAYVDALMQADAMSIPANIENGVEIRPRQSGPVFSVDGNGHLHMRYTARTRSIEWKQDDITQAAVKFLQDLFQRDSAYIFRYRLQANEGFISNNVLHNRTGFSDSESNKRMYYRARYYDRVALCDSL